MMRTAVLKEDLAQEYRLALQSYLEGAGETALRQAYELGRKAVENGLGLLEITAIHQEALLAILVQLPSAEDGAQMVKRVEALFLETLAPFEMVQRCFQETLAIANSRAQELETLNAQLEQRIQERTESLQVSLREKEVLLREIHHRVKNNLQIVSSLLDFESRKIQDPRLLEMFRENQNRIRSMALIHDSLYLCADLSRVDVPRYIRGLVDDLMGIYGDPRHDVRVETDLESVSLGLDKAIPCALFINELVSNALKHAFPEGRPGAIRIGLHRESPGELLLTVSDDGIGFPKDFNLKQVKSLGLRLVEALASQLNGTLRLGFQPGAGAAFSLTFSEDVQHAQKNPAH